MTDGNLQVSTRHDGKCAVLTLNRPDARNALDESLIAEATQVVVSIARATEIRAVIIEGRGEAFCAGTDIAWMEALAGGAADNDARRLANLLFQIRQLPKPVIARVHGAAIGAGVGLIAACDIAIASEDATFALPAVRLGTVPAVIGPFLTEAMGIRHARRYTLTGEMFGATAAERTGLIHSVEPAPHLDTAIARTVADIVEGGPLALKETKALMNEFGQTLPSPHILNEAAKISARTRKTDEAREGLAAFIERRKPTWQE